MIKYDGDDIMCKFKTANRIAIISAGVLLLIIVFFVVFQNIMISEKWASCEGINIDNIRLHNEKLIFDCISFDSMPIKNVIADRNNNLVSIKIFKGFLTKGALIDTRREIDISSIEKVVLLGCDGKCKEIWNRDKGIVWDFKNDEK